MTFASESGFATVPSCTVSGFLSGIHPVMTFASESGFITILSCMVNSFKALADGMSYSCLCLNKSKSLTAQEGAVA